MNKCYLYALVDGSVEYNGELIECYYIIKDGDIVMSFNNLQDAKNYITRLITKE